MRIGLAQLNPIVGDIQGNVACIIDVMQSLDADLIVTPEMSICGYPPRDLLLLKDFVKACEQSVDEVAFASKEVPVILGHPRVDELTGKLRNSFSVVQNGEIIARGDKQLLPSYDVFDEKRYFESGEGSCSFLLGDIKVGIAICEDFWRGEDAYVAPTYEINPIDSLIQEGCSLLISPSASPFVARKQEAHIDYACNIAKAHNVSIVMCNQVGANDDLIFNGGSFVAKPSGIVGMLPNFETGVNAFNLNDSTIALPHSNEEADCVRALLLGISDYFKKTWHTKAFVGLSGGIDSALTATLAVASIGKENVTGILMPSRFSSLGSVSDAEALAINLGIEIKTLPIEHLHKSFDRTMYDASQDITGVSNENMQARLRGLLLMAMANEENALLLSTGNKSELAVGYSTLYGDMSGAVSVIGDIYKTDVWSMSEWLNSNYEFLNFSAPPIPDSSITKLPSAELKPDQFDQDSLPPYDQLDEVLRLHIDFDLGINEIEDKSQIPLEIIQQVVALVDRSQFKREQSALILKINPRSFGRGRRMPIVMQRNWTLSRELS